MPVFPAPALRAALAPTRPAPPHPRPSSWADAKWLYEQSSVGDVIEVTGTAGKPMDRFGNGYGDWNLSWDEWLRGSALGAFKA